MLSGNRGIPKTLNENHTTPTITRQIGKLRADRNRRNIPFLRYTKHSQSRHIQIRDIQKTRAHFIPPPKSAPLNILPPGT